MVQECPLCTEPVFHCHGTLIQHADSVVECTDELCADLDAETHELVVECWQVKGGCGCVPAGVSAAS
jgi:hypothetical protein